MHNFPLGELQSPADNMITFGIIVLVRDGYDYGNLGNAYFGLDITHTDDWSTGTKSAQVYVNSASAYTVRYHVGIKPNDESNKIMTTSNVCEFF